MKTRYPVQVIAGTTDFTFFRTVELAPVAMTVIDAESGEPVADAIVAIAYPVFEKAGWNFHEGSWYSQTGDLFIGETQTGTDGRHHARFEGRELVLGPFDVVRHQRIAIARPHVPSEIDVRVIAPELHAVPAGN